MNNNNKLNYLLIGSGIIFGYYIWQNKTNGCVSCNTTETYPDGKMHPVLDPMFNVREACKEMALLEQHLNDPRKRCKDCIRKHFLTIEGLFEEAVSLDKYSSFKSMLKGKPHIIKVLALQFDNGKDYKEIAQGIRRLRKELMPTCFKYV
jgi:hypothetical protein